MQCGIMFVILIAIDNRIIFVIMITIDTRIMFVIIMFAVSNIFVANF